MPKIPEGMTELVGADIPRMDLVDKGANGRERWLIMKADGMTDGSNTNLFSADQVTELIKEAQEESGMADNTAPVVKDDPNLDAGGDPIEGSTGVDAQTPGSGPWEQVDADSANRWLAILARAKNALITLSEREEVEYASPGGDGEDLENVWDLQDAAGAIDWAIGLLAGYAAGEQAEADLEAEGVNKVAAVIEVAKQLDEQLSNLAVVEGAAFITKSGRVLSAANESALRDAAAAIEKVLAALPAAPVAEEDGVEKAETEEAPVVEKAETGEPVVDANPLIVKSIEEAVAKFGRMSPEARAARAEGLPETAPVVEKAEPILEVIPGETGAVTKDDAAPEGDGETPKLQAVFDANGDLVGVVDPTAIQPVEGATGTADPEAPDDADGAAPAPAAAAAPAVPVVPAAKAAEHDEETKPVEQVVMAKADMEALITERVSAAKAELMKEVESLRAPARPAVARYGVFQQPSTDLSRQGEVEKSATDEDVSALKAIVAKSGDPAAIQEARDGLTALVSQELAKQRAATPDPIRRPTPAVRQ